MFSRAAQLTCFYGCNQPESTEYSDLVLGLIGKREFHKFSYFKARKNVGRMTEILYCPNEDCPNPLIETRRGLKDSVIVCTSCSTQVCKTCEQRAHPVGTKKCPNQPNTSGRTSYTLWCAWNTRECPKCHQKIQKNGGCSHMYCTNCSTNFCWKCKGILWGGSGRSCLCLTSFSSMTIEALAYTAVITAVIVGTPIVIVGGTVGLICYAPYYGGKKLVKLLK